MAKANRMIIVGIDSISMSVLDQIIGRGYCPTIKRLIENGCYAQGRSFCPVETGTNWAVLSTGASPSVTGCNMGTHLPGMRLNATTRGFPSGLCKAEQIWNAARRGGRRSIIFDYPQSRPVNCEDAIHVGEDGRPGQGLYALSENCAWKTAGPYTAQQGIPNVWVHKIDVSPAVGWINLPAFSQVPLAIELPIKPGSASEYEWVKPFYALLIPEGDRGYTSVAFFSRKDYNSKLGEAALGDWSEPLVGEFDTNRGTVEAWTKAKVFQLSSDGGNVHIYCHQIYPVRGFAHPESIEQKLLAECGPYYPHTCRQQSIISGACDVWTFREEAHATAKWYRKAMRAIMESGEWDLFIQKWHPPDFCYHFGAFMIDERHPLYDPARKQEGWDFWGSIMNQGDFLIAQAMELAGDDAIVAVMSDHGGKVAYPGADREHASYNDILEQAGLIVRTDRGGVDWSRTKAWVNNHYVYVNLKGRDPDGCVEPGAEYEAVRQQSIDALLDAKDPETGRHACNLVCRIEDASMVGIGGDRVGDVFVWQEEKPVPPMTRAEFEVANPGVDLGSWEWPRHNSGHHRPDPFMIMAGPGFKQGYRRDTPTWVSYFAPTLAMAWGIPVPKDTDGGVIWDFLE